MNVKTTSIKTQPRISSSTGGVSRSTITPRTSGSYNFSFLPRLTYGNMPDFSSTYGNNFWTISPISGKPLINYQLQPSSSVEGALPSGKLEVPSLDKSKKTKDKNANAGSSKEGWNIAGAVGGAGLNVIDNAVTQTKYGKKQTTAGSALNTVGDAAIMTGNPYAIVGGLIAKGAGTILNLGYGNTFNEEGIQDIQQNGLNMRRDASALASTNSTNEFINTWNGVNLGYDFSKGYIGDEGWWSHAVSDKFKELADEQDVARRYVSHAMALGAKGVDKTTDDIAMANTVAYGGSIEIDPSTPVGYSIYTDKYIKDKLKNSSNMSNLFAGTPAIFDFGGGIQTKGADFDNNITYINTGGTHEENPYEGVLMGSDSQGTPNLVEQDEVRWGDYIFSDRLTVPSHSKALKSAEKRSSKEDNKVDVPYENKILKPYEGLTFADTAKKMIKRTGAEERNDAITMRGLDAELSVLAGVLEKERQKEELREMQEAIDNMSPEEFAMLQQLMESKQLALQLLERALRQLQMIPEGMDQMIPEEQQLAAYGGPIYGLGGLLGNWNNTPAPKEENILADGGFADWWDNYVHQYTDSENGFDYGKLYKSVVGEDGPTDSEEVYRALQELYNQDPSRFLPYDGSTYTFIEETPLQEPEAATEEVSEEDSKKVEAIEGPMAEVLKYKNLTSEEWNKLSDRTKERYLNQYKHSLKKADRATFEATLNAYNKQQEYKKQIEEYQKALRESFVNKEDLKDFDLETLDRLAKFVNPEYSPADLKGLSENEKQAAHEKLLEDIVTWSKDNNKTLADINAAFPDTPELYKDWSTVDYNDPATWTSNGYDLDEFTNRTAAYNGSLTAGNLIGNYAPDAEYNKDVFSTADTIDNIEALEADPTYQAYTEAVKDALARNAGVRYRYKEGTDSGYENLEFADENKKVSEDDYNLLHLFGRLVARTKTNPNGDPVPFFVSDGDYNKINEKITKDGKEYTPLDYLEHLRNDLKLGAMHLTPKELKARDLYLVKGTDLYHTLELIGGEDGDWRNYYDISEPATQEDGTRLFTLTPKKGIKMTRAESLPDGLTIGTDGTIKDANDISDTDPFPKASNWPYLVGAGLLLGALANNLLTPADYSNADALIKAAKNAGSYRPVSFSPIGHYLTYQPLDIWYELNRLNANSRATDRAILNSGANQGAMNAALLANAYNNQIGSGNLYRQALEYNDALRKLVGEFNKDTDKFNSEGFLKADMANQDADTRSKYATMENLKAGYAMRQAIDDAKANAVNVGLSGLANLAYNYASNKYNQDLLGWGMRHNAWGPGVSYKSSKGGKVRRKRGIGF